MFRFFEGVGASVKGLACCFAFAVSMPVVAQAGQLLETVAKLEADVGGRIGVVVRHTGSDWSIEHRPNERFPMASTFKALLCGGVLARVDQGQENLENVARYTADELVRYSPVTEKHVATGMSVGDLCEATITVSDNSAANFLLKRLGGPEGFTRFMRGIGDEDTRLDRWEVEMSESKPGDLRDTTTPEAISKSLGKLLFGDILQPHSRELLTHWMINNKVADALMRKHLPTGWRIADRSGMGHYGTRGNIAALWTETGEVYLAAIYMTGSDADVKTRNATIAEVGQAIFVEIKQR
ncbi:Beta-lactamase precursor [Pseudovibrio axinellae]|uniref:Beta-lactamase n=1 Tax=Pseudovibrio axinellae TaxID=989403 RepID=A0A165SXE3_9HYPH|nr:class A beta-lactamase [Pseudovibrio axinellae]KZL04610.1 Beta-lactamase precursor [Pseudovibrio axinellae]SEQ71436.1 beta-lactamase class A/beta-lactamase class A CARB-5 [Pseudovibrio axinellae]